MQQDQYGKRYQTPPSPSLLRGLLFWRTGAAVLGINHDMTKPNMAILTQLCQELASPASFATMGSHVTQF